MPYVLPYQPTRRDKLYDALIEMMPQIALAVATKGMSAIANIPNPGYGQTGGPQLNFPGGASTPTNPQELSQIQALGGVPSRQGGLSSYASTITPPAPYATSPRLNQSQFDQIIKNQQYQKTAQEMKGTPAENLKLDLANQQAQQQIKINEEVLKGDLIPVQLPTGQTIYMRPSKGGYVPIPQGQGASARDQARSDEFGALGTTTLPEELPNPKGMAEGTKATDTVTGQKYIVRKGSWSPL